MHQDQLDGLVTFICVAEHASFSRAALRLGVTPSAVSQVVRNLEQRLGMALFHRTTRSVKLTEAGLRFLDRVRPAVLELSEASDELKDSNGQPSGLLRLTVSRAAYLTVLLPVMGGFLERYPQVELELSLEGRMVDIVREGFDAGIRFGEQVERDMVAISVGPALAAHVIASPNYLARRGTPTHPHDLLEHDLIGYRHVGTGAVERWEFESGGQVIDLAPRGRLIVNESAALVHSALAGHGISYMINGYIEPFYEDGRLVRILEDWSPALPGYSLYYPDRRRMSRKLRVLIDYLRETAGRGVTGPGTII